MIVFPAVDIRGGRCVRLRRGRPQEETVYDEDPSRAAKRWEKEGASWLHLVDLDGALEGSPANRGVIRRVIEAVRIQVQVGGGVRDTAWAEELLALGAARVIAGTRALADPAWISGLAAAHPGKIAAAVDHRRGMVLVEGWKKEAGRPLRQVLEEADNWGLAAILVTDAARDGTLDGVDRAALAAAVAGLKTAALAAGGVRTAADVAALNGLNLAGVIVGRALYEGTVTLEEARRAAGDG